MTTIWRFVGSYSVRECVLEPLTEAGVDAELIEYTQKVTIFPTFLNSFNRALWNFFGSKVYPS